MQRDMALIREILLDLRDHNEFDLRGFYARIRGEKWMIDEHIKLLIEAGYIQTDQSYFNPDIDVRITWSGHEFIDPLSSPTVWEMVQQKQEEFGVEFSAEIVSALAGTTIRELLEM